MRFGRTISTITMAAFLASCGGDGGGNVGAPGGPIGGAPTPAPAPSPTPSSVACSLSDRQSWTLGVINQAYLFPDLVDRSVNPGDFNTVQSYIDALVAPARAENKDRFFTYITSIEAENEAASGSSAGFGARLALTSGDDIVVTESFENGPAFAAGIDRGTFITGIGTTEANIRSVREILASGGVDELNAALGPSVPNVSRFLRLAGNGVGARTVQVTKAEFNLDPISDRYGAQIIDDGGKKVGYLNLRTFFNRTGDTQLNQAFATFKQAGVTEMIVDYRYNGGGFIFVAEAMSNLMAADLVGRPYTFTEFSPNRSDENFRTDFSSGQSNAISAMKIAFIGFGGTASASELVMNAFIPYRGNNVALIGANTFGKPVGQEAYDRPTCDDRLRVEAINTKNANRQGDYFNGIAEIMPVTCRAPDDVNFQMGDPEEGSTRQALDYLAGRGTCTAIAGAPGVQGTRSAQKQNELLRPALSERTAMQHRVPGVY